MKQLFILFLLSISFSVLSQTTMIKSIHEKDGKIGIGTSQPDELLTVKGKIHTQEVLVDLEGAVAPDYVFEHYYESGMIKLTKLPFPVQSGNSFILTMDMPSL